MRWGLEKDKDRVRMMTQAAVEGSRHVLSPWRLSGGGGRARGYGGGGRAGGCGGGGGGHVHPDQA